MRTGEEESMAETRIEKDSLGEVEVPAGAYYGAQTERARRNFPVSGLRFPRRFIAALGAIKREAAAVNGELGVVPGELAAALGRLQPGSGTSTNMNANEVIANRAAELLGGRRGAKLVHPNDHVNASQS